MAIFVIGQGSGGHKGPYEMFAFETLTVGATSVGFTAATYDPTAQTNRGQATYAFVTIEADSISCRFDGTAAAATNHDLTTSDQLVLYGNGNIRNFRAIRITGDSTLRVSYGR